MLIPDLCIQSCPCRQIVVIRLAACMRNPDLCIQSCPCRQRVVLRLAACMLIPDHEDQRLGCNARGFSSTLCPPLCCSSQLSSTQFLQQNREENSLKMSLTPYRKYIPYTRLAETTEHGVRTCQISELLFHMTFPYLFSTLLNPKFEKLRSHWCNERVRVGDQTVKPEPPVSAGPCRSHCNTYCRMQALGPCKNNTLVSLISKYLPQIVTVKKDE